MKAVKFTVRHASVLKSANVFDHDIIQAKAFVVAFQKLLYVRFHHAKVIAPVSAQVNFIVEVLAFNVNPVDVERLHTVEFVAFISHVPDHIVIVRVLLLLEENAHAVIFLLFASNVPLFRVIAFHPVTVRASCKVRVHPGAVIDNDFAKENVELFNV